MNAAAYAREVDRALRDLPWTLRRELASELRGHLAELPPGEDLVERLGDPGAYAAEMRAAAGLDPQRGPIAFLRARRPRNVALAVLALVLAAVVIIGVAWVQSYQPIEWAGIVVPRHVPLNDQETVETIPFRSGGHFRLGVAVSNAGEFPVSIVGLGHIEALPVAFLPNPPLPFSVRLLASRPSKHWVFHGPYAPFAPIDLQPGAAVMLVLEGTFAKSCRPWQRGGVADVGTSRDMPPGYFPIRFHFLWKTETALIWPSRQIQISFPQGCR